MVTPLLPINIGLTWAPIIPTPPRRTSSLKRGGVWREGDGWKEGGGMEEGDGWREGGVEVCEGEGWRCVKGRVGGV